MVKLDSRKLKKNSSIPTVKNGNSPRYPEHILVGPAVNTEICGFIYKCFSA